MAWNQVFEIPFTKTPYEFHLHGLCDIQAGSQSTSLNVVKRWIKEIIDDPVDSGIIIPGDIEDEDRPSTRERRRSAFSDRPEVAYRDAAKHRAWIDQDVVPLLLPLQKTKYGIMGVLAGHHWTVLSPVLNSVQYICQELTRLSGKQVHYLGEMTSWMDLRFRHKNAAVRQLIHVQHGTGGGQSKSAPLNKLDRAAQGFDGNVFIRAHDCQLVATKNIHLYPKETKPGDEPEILERVDALLNLGSATKGYEIGKGSPSYIEQEVYRPVAMGWGTVKFRLRKASSWEDRSNNLKCDIRVEI